MLAFSAAVVGSTLLGAAFTVVLHVAMGTPELLATVTPSIVAGFGYSLLYCAGLTRAASLAGRNAG